MNFLDKDPRYTLVYEYYMKTAANAKNTGFSNTRRSASAARTRSARVHRWS